MKMIVNSNKTLDLIFEDKLDLINFRNKVIKAKELAEVQYKKYIDKYSEYQYNNMNKRVWYKLGLKKFKNFEAAKKYVEHTLIFDGFGLTSINYAYECPAIMLLYTFTNLNSFINNIEDNIDLMSVYNPTVTINVYQNWFNSIDKILAQG